MKKRKLLLFDLDGTLLRSDKTISPHTLRQLERCRASGFLIGVSTSRSEQNAYSITAELNPDVLISSGGALVKVDGAYIAKALFTAGDTKRIIKTAHTICGKSCEITVDTSAAYYWNYKTVPKKRTRAGVRLYGQTILIFRTNH